MGSPVKPDFIGKKVRVEHFLDEVRIVVTCNSDYEAVVFYEDFIERAKCDGLVTFHFKQRRPCPSN